MGWDKVGGWVGEGGKVEGLFMPDKAFMSCLTFGLTPENHTQEKEF